MELFFVPLASVMIIAMQLGPLHALSNSDRQLELLAISIDTYSPKKWMRKGVNSRIINAVSVGFMTPERLKLRNAKLQAAAESREWSKLMGDR